MRYLVFAVGHNPAVDKPIYKQSEARGHAMLDSGVAVQVGERSIQLVSRAAVSLESDGRSRIASFGDWFSSKISYLPKECWPSHGPFVRITTKQLAT